MNYVSVWECPECGITYDADTVHVPEVDAGVYYCDHCAGHGWGYTEMEVKEYAEGSQ